MGLELAIAGIAGVSFVVLLLVVVKLYGDAREQNGFDRARNAQLAGAEQHSRESRDAAMAPAPTGDALARRMGLDALVHEPAAGSSAASVRPPDRG